jgi:hypothetical protein
MPAKIGANAKLYYRSAGSFAVPTWTVIGNVRDLSADLSMDEADASIRGGGGVKQTEPVHTLDQLEWEMVEDTTDPAFLAVKAAHDAKTIIDLFCCSGDKTVSGETYFRAEFKVPGWKKTEPLNDANKFAVTAKPAYSTNLPQSGVTGAGTIWLARAEQSAPKGSPRLLFVRVLRAGATVGATNAYAASGGTLAAGVDYTATSGTITWADAEIYRDIGVPLLGANNAGTFNFTISAPGGGASLGTPTVQVVTLA